MSYYQAVIGVHASRIGFSQAAFELTEEELPEILEEFFPNDVNNDSRISLGNNRDNTNLKQKLEAKTKVKIIETT